MEIEYDKDADAMYIRLRQGELGRTKEVDANTLLDLDKNGKLLGIELLDVRKRLPETLDNVHIKGLHATITR